MVEMQFLIRFADIHKKFTYIDLKEGALFMVVACCHYQMRQEIIYRWHFLNVRAPLDML